jgi:hypothetical protein
MLWWSITAILAVAFAVLALSNALYDLTSPPLLSFHVWLRKLYSLAAFASVGYSYSRARLGGGAQQPLWESGAAVGAYSACIELLQFVGGSREGIWWNAIDTAFGAAGGALGALCLRQRRP